MPCLSIRHVGRLLWEAWAFRLEMLERQVRLISAVPRVLSPRMAASVRAPENRLLGVQNNNTQFRLLSFSQSRCRQNEAALICFRSFGSFRFTARR